MKERKPTRLKNYDYSTNGAYFITICSYKRKCIFSNIVGAIHESPLRNKRSVISNCIGFLKMNVSKQIHIIEPDVNIWQRSFHDHIIRNENDYLKIWEYIDTNVLKWSNDCYYK